MNTPDAVWAAPIWVDVMAMDAASRVPLDYPGTVDDLARHQIELREGLQLTLYTNDATAIEVDDPLIGVGLVEYDGSSARWFARFDVKGLTHLSDMDARRRSMFLAARDIGRR